MITSAIKVFYSDLCLLSLHRFHQCLTMDVIVSAAFGLEVDSQMNPEEPILNAVRLATTPNPRRQILLTLLSLMPFGQGIMEKIPSIWMGHLKPLIDIAEEIVCFKRNAESTTRKVKLFTIFTSRNRLRVVQLSARDKGRHTHTRETRKRDAKGTNCRCSVLPA